MGHGTPRFLAGPAWPPVLCLIHVQVRLIDIYTIQQITFSQQDFKQFEDFLATVLTIFTSLYRV